MNAHRKVRRGLLWSWGVKDKLSTVEQWLTTMQLLAWDVRSPGWSNHLPLKASRLELEFGLRVFETSHLITESVGLKD
jgi:hypothetical protein